MKQLTLNGGKIMDYKFQTTVRIPAEAISRIGTDIGTQFFGQLNIQCAHLEDEDVKIIMQAYGDAVREHAESNRKTIDGFYLPSHVVNEIAKCLTNGHKINAIKVFREETGAALIDSKYFIERYETNEKGAQKIIEDFTS
jgi:ribosomal protein L7/L12